MSGSVFLDTNIIIHLLRGNESVVSPLKGKELFISFVTELELLSYKHITKEEENIIHTLLEQIRIIEINPQIKNEVIRLRRKYGFKLPDAIIIASSGYLGMPMLTADKALEKASSDIEIILLDI